MAFIAFAILTAVLGQTQEHVRDAAAIDAAKKTNVHDIDPALPKGTFEAWLRGTVGPQAITKWAVNDCGEQTGNPALDKDRDFPMCVEAEVGLAGGRKLFISLVVGTFRKGLSVDTPKFWSAAIMKTGEDPQFIKDLAQVAARIHGGGHPRDVAPLASRARTRYGLQRKQVCRSRCRPPSSSSRPSTA